MERPKKFNQSVKVFLKNSKLISGKGLDDYVKEYGEPREKNFGLSLQAKCTQMTTQIGYMK